MKNKFNKINGFMPSMKIIFELVYKKGYKQGRAEAIKEIKNKEIKKKKEQFLKDQGIEV